MPETKTLPGRSGIFALFDDCLRRPADGPTRDLPVVVLLGTRGSGKTWMLTYLRDACRRSGKIPYAFVDCTGCAAEQERPVWRLSCDLIDALQNEKKKWPEFGRLSFPRATLARLAAEHDRLPDDLEHAHEELRNGLRARFEQRVSPIFGLLPEIAQALHVPQAVINIVVGVVRFVAGSHRAVDRLYRTGLQWYGHEFGDSESSGLSVLVKLNRNFHPDGQQELADRMLCTAFLDDLDSAFTRKRKFNCAILLDNCDGPAGIGFLNLLTELRARRSGRRDGDPLVVVATSGTLPGLAGLADGWTFPWEPDGPGARRVPNPDEANYGYWHGNRTPRYKPAFWWFPVHLRDLAAAELGDTGVHKGVHEFVHRLTEGHPWSAPRVLGSITTGPITNGASPGVPSETELRTVLDRFTSQAGYLLADIPKKRLRRNLVLWSAAWDIDTAANAGVGEDGRQDATDLHDELVKRLWLVPDDRLPGMLPRGPRLHPWLRRILLHRLATDPETPWIKVHQQLRDYVAAQHRRLDAAYYGLACGELSGAIDYLASQFHRLPADSWIREFDAVTDAPSNRNATETANEQFDALMRERSPLDRVDRVRDALWSMVAARWIWSDPLGDPLCELTDTIAAGYEQLADEAQTGKVRYRKEARKYRAMRRTWWGRDG